jgi:hypothetical protein
LFKPHVVVRVASALPHAVLLDVELRVGAAALHFAITRAELLECPVRVEAVWMPYLEASTRRDDASERASIDDRQLAEARRTPAMARQLSFHKASVLSRPQTCG